MKALAVFFALALVGFLCPSAYGYADDQVEQESGANDYTVNDPVEEGGSSAVPNEGDGETDSDVAPEADAPKAGDDAEATADGSETEEETALPDEEEPKASALEEAEEEPVRSFSGATMFETAAAEAKAAYPEGVESAVIVGPGDAWIDALSATGLAASKGPILFTERDTLHPATRQALAELGVKSVVIVGGTAAVSAGVEQAIVSAGVGVETRLGGSDCFDTQMKIYEYGQTRGLWDSSMAIVATADHFGDALSASPVAYAKKIPVFLVASNGQLRGPQQQALVQGARAGGFTSIVLVGGPAAVSMQVEGFVTGLTYWNGGSYVRLGGATQYETSAAVATWATSSQGLSWDRLAFTTGKAPYDALAGSVLQGGSRSVLLMIDEANSATLNAAAQYKDSISHVRFLGGTSAVSQTTRNSIVSRLSLSTAASPKAASALESPVVSEDAGAPSAVEADETFEVPEKPDTTKIPQESEADGLTPATPGSSELPAASFGADAKDAI